MRNLTSPYELYPEQKEYLQNIINTTREGGLLMIEAGTGFGKTIANLLGGLTVLDSPSSKIIYLTRTLQQGVQVITELRQINKSNPETPITGIQLTSRRRFCKHSDVKRERDPEKAWELCKSHQHERNISQGLKSSSCKSVVADINRTTGVPTVISVENLQEFAKRHDGCGYLTSRELTEDRKVICGSYFYYLVSEVREKLRLHGDSPSQSLIIFDEGHNLDNAAIDAFRDTIDVLAISRALRELNTSKDILSSSLSLQGSAFFRALLEKYETDIPRRFPERRLIPGSFWNQFLEELGWSSKKLQQIAQNLLSEKDKVKEGWNKKFPEATVIGKLAYERLLELLTKVMTQDPRYRASWDPKRTHPCLIIDLLEPTVILDNIFKSTKNLTICSASLTPIEFHREVLGVSDGQNVVYGGIANPNNVQVYYTGKVANHKLSTQYKFVNTHPETYNYYREAISAIASKVPGGTLVLFPSYSQLEKVLNKDFGEIAIFKESRHAEFPNIREQYFTEVDESGKAIFAGVFRGRISEGADFPNEYSRAVIICGIPFDPPAPIISARREYYEQKQQGMGWEWYRLKAYQRVMQALGRGWRNATDYAIGVLLDDRYKSGDFLQYFPHWLKVQTEQKNDVKELLSDIEAFFSRDRSDQLLKEKRTKWQKINQQFINPALNYINEGNLEEAERWLLHGFFQTQDGWVAYHLGEVFQRQNKLDNARKFFQIAENNLPLTRYKQVARQALTDLDKKTRIDYTSCILCSYSAITGLICSTCSRMTCAGCIADMLEVGKKTCVYCGGEFDIIS